MVELTVIVSIVALVVSLLTAIILFVGHIKRTRSEQFHFSLEIWDRIAAQVNNIYRWATLGDVGLVRENIIWRILEALRNELNSFVFLTEKGEINNPDVRE